jgi:hypothetical protein
MADRALAFKRTTTPCDHALANALRMNEEKRGAMARRT